jgi:hypothetical protein
MVVIKRKLDFLAPLARTEAGDRQLISLPPQIAERVFTAFANIDYPLAIASTRRRSPSSSESAADL